MRVRDDGRGCWGRADMYAPSLFYFIFLFYQVRTELILFYFFYFIKYAPSLFFFLFCFIKHAPSLFYFIFFYFISTHRAYFILFFPRGSTAATLETSLDRGRAGRTAGRTRAIVRLFRLFRLPSVSAAQILSLSTSAPAAMRAASTAPAPSPLRTEKRCRGRGRRGARSIGIRMSPRASGPVPRVRAIVQHRKPCAARTAVSAGRRSVRSPGLNRTPHGQPAGSYVGAAVRTHGARNSALPEDRTYPPVQPSRAHPACGQRRRKSAEHRGVRLSGATARRSDEVQA